MNSSKIFDFINQQVENITNRSQQMFVRAGASALNIHHFGLNMINQISKRKNHTLDSPFNLFSQSTAPSRRFKMTELVENDLANKIAHFSHQENLDHPLQDFIKSLFVQSRTVAPVNEVGDQPAVNSPFSAEILEVIQENHEFKTLRMKRPKEWNFLPGQYLELRAQNSNTTKPAILAIASGVDRDYIEITAKPNGNPGHPNYCLNSQVGDYLMITGPLGSHFPLHLITPETPVLVLGGGSGLTALKSIMQSIPQNTDTKLIYSSKFAHDLIYHEDIEKWKSEGHIISLTQEKAENFAEGRITEHLKNVEIKPNTLIFLCGPEELVLQTTTMLADAGVPRTSIYGSLPATANEGGPVYRGDHPKMMKV